MEAPLLGEPLPVELMNTIWGDRAGVYDALADADGLAAWLTAVKIDPDGADEQVNDRFRRLRDALRRLAAVATGDQRPAAESAIPDPSAAVAAVNEACACDPTWSELVWGDEPTQITRSGHTAAERALSTIAEQAVVLFTGPDRAKLRPCLAPGCVLYFYCANPRREWCSVHCGNRARVARHYRRHRDEK